MLSALFFDQDGVIVDTERDGHRVAFNTTFREFGIDAFWDEATYGELLKIGGGKERMRAFFDRSENAALLRGEEPNALIAELHKRKTEVFVELITSGALPLRPGVERLMVEANRKGVVVAICTTSNEQAAQAVAERLLKNVKVAFILSGDIVRCKKPDPEIYHLALERSGLEPARCLVIEDSQNGVEAARAAQLRVVATVNAYTEREKLDQASAVVSCLGDGSLDPARLIRGPAGFVVGGEVRIEALELLL